MVGYPVSRALTPLNYFPLGGLFNPQAFLTAISQQTARKNEWPLDKVVLTVDMTKKWNKDDFTSPPQEGAYLWGIYMAGARWDVHTGLIQEANHVVETVDARRHRVKRTPGTAVSVTSPNAILFSQSGESKGLLVKAWAVDPA